MVTKIEAMAVLLASVMEADIIVRNEEIHAGQRILSRIITKQGDYLKGEWEYALTHSHLIDEAVAVLLREPETARKAIIEDLWEMAISDAELHLDEHQLIHEIARKLNVPARPDGEPPLPITSGIN